MKARALHSYESYLVAWFIFVLSILIFSGCATSPTVKDAPSSEPQATAISEKFSFDKLEQGTISEKIMADVLRGQTASARAQFVQNRHLLDTDAADYLDTVLKEAEGTFSLKKTETVKTLVKQLSKRPNPLLEEWLLSRLVSDNKMDAATGIMRSLVKKSRNEAHWASWMGWLSLKQKRLGPARYHFLRALSLKGSQAMAWYGLGQVFESERELMRAEQAYMKAVEQQPYVGAYHVRLALLRLRRGDTDGATYHVHASRQLLSPKDPQSLYVQARLEHLKNNRDEALKLYTECLVVQPQHLGSLIGSAQILSQVPGREEDALKRIEQAMELERRPPARRRLSFWAKGLTSGNKGFEGRAPAERAPSAPEEAPQ